MIIDTSKIDLGAIIENQRLYYRVVVPVELEPGLVELRLARPIESPVLPCAPIRGALISDVAARALIAAENRCF